MENRINSIDIIRGLAIIIMIPFHTYSYWINTKHFLFGGIINFFGELSAPFFFIVSGMSYYIFLINRFRQDLSKTEIFYDVLKRATFIFIISTLLRMFFGFAVSLNLFFFIYWSLFQLIAFSMIIFFFIPFLNRNLRIFIYIGLLTLIFMLNHIISYYEATLFYILIEGSFPIIPCANFFVIGLILSDLLLNLYEEQFKKVLLICIIIGSIDYILWNLYGGEIKYIWITTIFISSGLFLIFFPIIHYFVDMKKLNFFLQKIIIRWGKVSFSLYYIHFGIIAISLIIFPLIFNDFQLNGLVLYQYILILIILFLALEIFLRLWQRFNFKFSIEWFMSKFTKKSLFSDTTQIVHDKKE